MKKLFVLLIALTALFSFALTASAAAGDPDGDGDVTVKDARFVLRAAVGLERLNNTTRPGCDADHNGKVNTADARIVLRVAVGLGQITHPARTGKEPMVSMLPAACTKEGKLRYRCSCGEILSAPIPAKGHSPGKTVKENLVRPTCAKAGGWDEVVYCTACNAELSRKACVQQPLPHTPGDAVEENYAAATCVTPGGCDTVVYCTVCGGEYSRVHITFAVLDHTPAPAAVENEVPPTCDSAGSYDAVVYCAACGKELSREKAEVDPLPHTLIETVPAAYIGETPAAPSACFGCVNCGQCFADAGAGNPENGYYATVTAALAAAEAGDTVVLVRDYILSEDVSVPAGVTLLVPYSFENTGFGGVSSREMHYANTAANGAESAVTPAGTDVFCTLRLSGCALTVEEDGLLAVGGTFSGAQPVGGATYGAHGEIVLDETSEIVVKGRFSVRGYITGSGSVFLRGGALYLPFIITDYHGGTYSSIAYKVEKQLPFTSYACINVQCPFEMTGASAVYGYCALYASSVQNVTTTLLIAHENALLNLSPDAVLRCKYNANKTVAGYPELGSLAMEAEGNLAMRGLSMTAAGVQMDLSVVPFSIPYHFSFTQKSGTLTLSQSVALMPGAVLNVAEGAALEVRDRFYVLDGFAPGMYSAYHYPTGDKLAAAGYSERGRLTVDGEMTVADGALFAGLAETKGTGKITVGEATLSAVFSNGLMLNEKYSFIAKAIATNRTEYALTARLANAEGELAAMEAGKTYRAVSDAQTALTGYAYVKFGGDVNNPTSETVTVLYTAPEALTGAWEQVI